MPPRVGPRQGKPDHGEAPCGSGEAHDNVIAACTRGPRRTRCQAATSSSGALIAAGIPVAFGRLPRKVNVMKLRTWMMVVSIALMNMNCAHEEDGVDVDGQVKVDEHVDTQMSDVEVIDD